MLADLATRLRESLGILHKQDIQIAAKALGWESPDIPNKILLGDDCAAIPDGDGYLLLAAEGMLPQLIETDPWFAGWCAVMVNVSDIHSMGGRAIAIVDTLWSKSPDAVPELLAGMKAASAAYQVPIVGGHTNLRSANNALSVAILGRASNLLTSFNSQPDDLLMMAIDLRGAYHPDYPFWNAATKAAPVRLRQSLATLPQLAELELCDAAKDISMGGIIGTLLMFMETSQTGAILDLDQIPMPTGLDPNVDLEKWLVSFPSYGFLLSVRPDKVAAVQALFHAQDLACAVVGTVTTGTVITLRSQDQSVEFWDFATESLTGFGKS